MKLPFGKPGISLFLFVALSLVFNWPLLSIPASDRLFGWLFSAWGLAIALLFLAAQGAGDEEALPTKPGGPAGVGAGAGCGSGPEQDPEQGLKQGVVSSAEGDDV